MIRIDINSTVLGEGKTSIAGMIEQLLRVSEYSVVTNYDNQWTPEEVGAKVAEFKKGEEAHQVVIITDGGYHEKSIKEVLQKHLPESIPNHQVAELKKRSAKLARLEHAMQGATLTLPEFLDWMTDRLIGVYKESPNVDFVLSCRIWAEKIREALKGVKVQEDTTSEEHVPDQQNLPSDSPLVALVDVCNALSQIEDRETVTRILSAADAFLGTLE